MLKINFIPKSNKSEFTASAKKYSQFWSEESDNILNAIKKISGLLPKAEKVDAIIGEATPQSYPLRFRFGADENDMRRNIIHELLHRLTYDNNVAHPTAEKDISLVLHKKIDLVLYDIWCDLYGEGFANQCVEIESNYDRSFYRQAWRWALAMTKEDRQKLWEELKSK